GRGGGGGSGGGGGVAEYPDRQAPGGRKVAPGHAPQEASTAFHLLVAGRVAEGFTEVRECTRRIAVFQPQRRPRQVAGRPPSDPALDHTVPGITGLCPLTESGAQARAQPDLPGRIAQRAFIEPPSHLRLGVCTPP